MESTEEDEDRLTTSSPEQPRPSTSKAVSPPHLDGPSNPESPILEEETLLLTSNHVTSDTRETGREISEAGPWVGPYAVLRYLEFPPLSLIPPGHSKLPGFPRTPCSELPLSMIGVVYAVIPVWDI